LFAFWGPPPPKVLCHELTLLREQNRQLLQLVHILHAAVSNARSKHLSNPVDANAILTMCASCKKIRDDSGLWEQVESFFKTHANILFSHGICPDCAEKLYPKFVSKK
jgi:Fe2+ or Zn2+ uptake regulation protein